MIPISMMIKNLTESYKEVSVEAVQYLCEYAGIEYREPSEAEALLKDLREAGYKLKVHKYTNTDISVGQYIILTDLELNVVKGFRIYIDFEGYVVRQVTVPVDEELPFLKGEIN